MRKVLVPFDGSGSALRAVAYALTLGNVPAEGEIHLVNVQAPIPGLDLLADGRPSAVQHYREQRMADGERVLAAAVQLLERAGVRRVATVRLGDPAETIAAYQRDAGCETVVMGTRGLGAIAGLLLGSVATKVLHLVQVPVTLVR